VALALVAQCPQLCRSVAVIEATWRGLRYATSGALQPPSPTPRPKLSSITEVTTTARGAIPALPPTS